MPLEMKEKVHTGLKEKVFLFWIQTFYPVSKNVFSNVNPTFLFRIQTCNYGSKVFTTDPKFYLRIQSCYAESKVLSTDPKL